MNFIPAIESKRDGKILSPETIESFVREFTAGKIPEYQMAAMLMAIYFRGLNTQETRALTLAMRDSGDTLKFPKDKRPLVDKHSSGGVGDKAGAGAFEDDDQPKGKSAIGLTSYANGSRSDPSLPGLQDPRHQLMLENEKDSKDDHGGREGDTAMYHQADKNIQLHFAGGDEKSGLKPGAYLSTDAAKNKIRLQLVKVDDDSQQQSSQPQARGGGQSGGGQQQQKKEGQRPLLKKESSTFIDIDGGGNTITIRHGSCYVVLTGKHVTAYYENSEKSMRVDADHTHIRHKDFRIWVDKEGCWATVPVLVKQDELDN